MNISLTFDASVNSQQQDAISRVRDYFDSLFTDNININITVQFGAISGLGTSSVSLDPFTYTQIRNALIGDATTADDTTANNTLPATDPNPNTHTYYLFRGEQKALGLLDANNFASDGTVTFTNAANQFDYDRSDGITSGLYDFFGVAVHEFSEILGRAALTGVSNNTQHGPANGYYPFDLFHYSSAGTRDFSGTTPGYFSIDGGTTNLGDFNTNVNEDWGDWANSVPNDAFRAFSDPGVYNNFTLNDMRLMDVLGYNRAVDTIAVNGTVSRNIEFGGNHDYLRVQLIAGHNYVINERGAPSGGGTLTDTLLALDNGTTSVQLVSDDDGGKGFESQLTVHVNTTGFYYVDAAAFSSDTGTYQLELRDAGVGSASTHFQNVTYELGNFGTNAGGWTDQNHYPRALADVNGDGLADIVGFGSGGVNVSLATYDGHFAAPTYELANFGTNAGGWTNQDQYPRLLGDVNGDGKADIVAFGAGGVNVSLATGNGHFAQPTYELGNFGTNAGGWTDENHYPRLLGDVNGDGKADIVAFGAGGVNVSLATGNGHFAAPTYELGNFGTNAGGWTDQDHYPRLLGDVNGDHMADIVAFGSGGVFVSLATGGGHFAAPTFELANFGTSAGGWTDQDHYPRQLADVNADGLADIVGFANGGVLISLATGSGHFAAPTFDVGNFGAGAGGWSSENLYPRLLGDVSGDQRADIVAFGAGGVNVAEYHNWTIV